MQSLAGALTVLVTSACSGMGTAQEQRARDAAAEFYRLLGQDPESACAVLAPGTRQELEATFGPCEESLAAQDLPEASAAQAVEVYGKQAMVTLDADVAFLAHFGDGWRVTAAGCVQVPERPYECSVKGP